MSISAAPSEADLDLAANTFSSEPPVLKAIIGRRTIDDEIVELLVSYAEVGDKAIYQGDIVIGDAEVVAEREQLRNSNQFGLIVTSAGKKWRGGRVPFMVGDRLRAKVEAAAAHIAGLTKVRLAPCSDADVDYLRFVVSDTNQSYVGRQGGEQLVELTLDCTVGTVIHEICHAVGLWHEQCRPDRDQYVTIIEEKVRAGYMPQFDKQETNAARIGTYDYRSIMHYSATAFSDPEGSVTIRTKNGESIGQRNGLSAGDIAALAALYP